MTVVFIAWGNYSGFADTVKCARAFAGCPVFVLSDAYVLGQEPNISKFNKYRAWIDRLKTVVPHNKHTGAVLPAVRWFILEEWTEKFPQFPVFCADWDVMIMRKLDESYEPFRAYDYTISTDQGCQSAAYCINRPEPLRAYCDMLRSMINTDSPALKGELNDMALWTANQRLHNWNVGNLWDVKNGSVFDHNMHCGADRFKVEPNGAKVIDCTDGKPSFVAHDGSLVRANTIHCWGTYKTRTGEIMKLSGA